MKKFILALFILIFSASCSYSYETDYRQIYMNLEVPKFSYMHALDPNQYFDYKSSTYAIYPLFRLSSPLYFKSITVAQGYYLLTPTVYKDKDYILFKTNGRVVYTIPVYKKEIVPEDFYDTHLPKPKLTKTQKLRKDTLTYIGTHFNKAQLKPTVKTFLEVNDLDNSFVQVIVYYGNYRYYTIFRSIQM